MPKTTAGLTTAKVKAFKSAGYYADGGGLYLQVTEHKAVPGTEPNIAKSWIFRFTLNGKRREMGLGSVRTFNLIEAREKALRARQLVAEGIDPLEARQAKVQAAKVEAAKAMTFKTCATAYIEAQKAGWRSEEHRNQWTTTLATYAYPVLGDLPVGAIDTALVMKVLEPIWATKTETASRLRQRIAAVLDWAKVRGQREGDNPAQWKGHLEALLPAKARVAKTGHYAALPYAEIPDFFAKLRGLKGVAARALEFAILTAARTGEVLETTWSEIDMEGCLWTIPGERMKAAKEHRVHLTEPAMAVLREMKAKGRDPYVFARPGTNAPLSNMAMAMLIRRMWDESITPHGFRSTFKDWCADRTNFPVEVAEMALAHAVSDKVEAAYRRSDMFEKRRRLAEAWAGYCTATGNSVVKLRA